MRLSAAAVAFSSALALYVALSGSNAYAGVCSNEYLRAELRSALLPDCRAYERVTPSYKESSTATQEFAVSSSGSRVLGGSIGIFGGAEQAHLHGFSNIDDTTYLFSRTPLGWKASSIEPPSTRYYSAGIDDASTNLDAFLWELSPAGGSRESSASSSEVEVSDLYLERPVGVFNKVGPATPLKSGPNSEAYEYLGASSDLSRVLFTAPLPTASPSASSRLRWPFDQTIPSGNTLYEYVGLEQSGEEGTEPSGESIRKPVLVGVKGARGSTTLISTCGTRLGSTGQREKKLGSVYNAISSSGTRIFFTAVGTEEAAELCGGPRVGELYVREELPSSEGEVPATEVRTVAISEPTKEECSKCLTEESSRRLAVFQGASLDGSKVFFTTEQELLPGAKGNNLYEYNFSAPMGERVSWLSSGPVKSEVQGVVRISEDGSHVYFVAHGRLTSEPRGGGCLLSLSAAELIEEDESGGRCRPKEGTDNLYVDSGGKISFIATLVAPTLTSPGDSSVWASADNRPTLASEEGFYLVFSSIGDLVGEGLTGEKSQIFQYNANTETLVRASIGQDGYASNNRSPLIGDELRNSFGASYERDVVDTPTSASGGTAPADGAVFFSSPDALTPDALNDELDTEDTFLVPNIYEYREGQLYLLSDGHDVSTVDLSPVSNLVGWNASGGDVFFFTSDSLIPEDSDTQEDLYDARANGGFPTPISSPECIGEACQGSLSTTPGLAQPEGSAVQAAEDEEIISAGSAQPVVVKPKLKAATKKHKATNNKHKAQSKKRLDLRRSRARRGGHR
jgi:hypothetical protein